jgi:lysophospholipase L1-like esterase
MDKSNESRFCIRIPCEKIAHSVILIVLLSVTPQMNAQKKMETTNPLRYLALGDSYTIGESVEPAQRFPAQLVSFIRERDVAIDEPIVIAQTGWTIDELNTAIDKANPIGTFSVVSLLIGVNNQYRGRSVEEYREEFRVLLRRSIGFAGGDASHVVVVSIPDWGVMPFAEGRDRKQIAKEIDAFNALNWEESVRSGTLYVDVTPISREATRFPDLIASDGLHPSAVQYKYWVDLMGPKVIKVLSPIELQRDSLSAK